MNDPSKDSLTPEQQAMAKALKSEDPPVPAALETALVRYEQEQARKLTVFPHRAVWGSVAVAAALVMVSLLLWQPQQIPSANPQMKALATYPTHQAVRARADDLGKRMSGLDASGSATTDQAKSRYSFISPTDTSLERRMDDIRARLLKLKEEPTT
ncbi:MAG: hypothetical protein AAGF10_06430 [Verrucomicrobiota bacterium]